MTEGLKWTVNHVAGSDDRAEFCGADPPGSW